MMTKYVFGLDYTFKNQIYISGQYLHGFLHERGSANLEDYFMFGLEWRLFGERLKLAPINGGIEVKDFKDIGNNYALIFTPEITYQPMDNAKISLGGHLIEGKETTTFGKMKDKDEFFLKAMLSFWNKENFENQ